MCRPPDFTPASDDFEGDALQVDDSYGWDDNATLEAALLQAQGSSILGKRSLFDEASLSQELSRASKLPRAVAPVSSAFDSAAASFMAKMEQSMMQDLQRQQQQKTMAASSAEDTLLQRALLEQQSKVQQLQQLQLLKQLQANSIPSMPQVLPQQRQLLIAQQHLMQQSKAASLASVVKQEPSSQWNAETKLQALMNQAPAAPIFPKPAAAPGSALAALLGAKANAASSMIGFGAPSLPPFQCAALALEDEKKCKRMQSNRASAKRSRQRRQARLEELDHTTAQLHEENFTMCNQLEAAHEQIHALEEKNRSLTGEVAELRKMLGMTAHSSSNDCTKSDSEAAVSMGVPQASCAASDSSAPERVVRAPAVKVEVDLTGELSEEEGIDQLNGFLGLGDVEQDCFDELLPQGDVLSELLACLDG